MDQIFEKLGTAAVQNIQNDYGQNPDVTGLWDTTMTTVRLSSFYTDTKQLRFHF